MQHTFKLDTDCGHAAGVELQPNALFLLAKDGNFGDAINGIKPFSQIVRCIKYLGVGKAFTCDGNRGDSNVSKVCINKRALRALWQLAPAVIHFVANVLEHADQLVFGNGVVDVQLQDRDTCEDAAFDILDFTNFAGGAFQWDSDQVFHPFRRHAWELCGDNRCAHSNGRIFPFGDIHVRQTASNQQTNHDEDGEAGLFQPKTRQGFHVHSPSRRLTRMPSLKNETPAEATRSPMERPSTTRMAFSRTPPMDTSRTRTVSVAAS